MALLWQDEPSLDFKATFVFELHVIDSGMQSIGKSYARLSGGNLHGLAVHCRAIGIEDDELTTPGLCGVHRDFWLGKRSDPPPIDIFDIAGAYRYGAGFKDKFGRKRLA